MGKRIIAWLLMLVMMVGMLPEYAYATEGTGVIEETEITTEMEMTEREEDSSKTETEEIPDIVTRADWLEKVEDTFGFYVAEDNYPDNYFSDISSTSEDYYTIMLAAEFGLLDIEAGEAVYPNEPTTREFAAQTLNYCLGFQLEEENYSFSDIEEVTYPDDAQIALNRGWFALVDGAFEPDTYITSVEMEVMLADAESVLDTAYVDENYDSSYEFADFVVVYPQSTMVSVDECDTVTIEDSSVELTEGDTFVVWPSELPSIYVAETITEEGNTIVVETSEADASTAVLSVDSSGVVDMDLSQFEEDEGVEVSYVRTQAQADSMISLYGISVEKDSVVATKDFSIGDGGKVSISCTLSNLALSQKIDTENKEFYVEVTGTTAITGGVSGDVISEALGTTNVVIGSVRVAGVGKVEVSVDLALNGKITATYTGDFKAGMQYSEAEGFRLVKNFVKKSFNTTAEVNATVGIKVTVGLDLLVLSGNIYATTGITVKLTTTTYNDGKLPKNCSQISAWLYVTLGASAKLDLAVWSKSWDKSLDIYTSTNSPVRLSFHYEDDKQVAVCTRTGEDGKKKVKYVTPINSPYGTSSYGDTSSTGTDDEGNETAIWTYSVSDYKATITGYSGSASIVSVPTTLDGYKVTAIGASAFKDNKNLIRVILPNTIASIGNKAFYGCISLEEIDIPKEITMIGEYAFAKATSLETVKMNYNNVVAYEHTVKIGEGAFESCTSLRKVELSENVIDIDSYAFRGCTVLEKLILPESVTTLGSRIIANTAVENITIPKNVSKCRVDESIIEVLKDGPLAECIALKTVILQEGMKTVPAYLCSSAEYTSNVDRVFFPNTITCIEKRAFYGCISLEEINIPKEIRVIGEYAFAEATALETVKMNYNNVVAYEHTVKIGEGAFEGCTSLRSVELSENVIDIDSYAFRGCIVLEKLILPESVTTLGSRIIANTAVESITIPKNVSKCRVDDAYVDDCKDGPLAECIALKTVILEEGMKIVPAYLCSSAEYVSNVERVSIPSTVTKIEKRAFQYSIGLKEIILPSGLRTIGDYAFYNCTSVQEIDIPKEITMIGEYAFAKATSLETVKMNYNNVVAYEHTVKIGEGAFESCISLRSVELSENVINIDNYAFRGCIVLEKLILSESVTTLGSRIIANTAVESIIIPKNVSICGVDSEYGANWGDGPLAECIALKTVILEEGMKTVPAYLCSSAEYVSNVERVSIPSTVTKIEERAFQYSIGLKEIILPSGLEKIGDYAFYNCTNITDVYYMGTLDDWNAITIGSNSTELTSATLHYHTHTYGAGVVTAPTCTIDGYTTYTCTECGSTYTDNTVAAKGHTEVIDAAKDATCAETGLTEGSHCYVCNKTFIAQTIIPTLEHTYTNKVTKRATCEEEGITTYTCSVCKYSYTEPIPATNHAYSISEVTTLATCQEEGVMTYYCTNCGGSKTEAIPTIDHDYVATVTAATCVKMGYTTYTCSMCEDNYKTAYTATVDHSYGDEWASNETIHYHACANCDNKQYAAEHTFAWIVDKEATTSETGLKHEECSVCAYKRSENTVIDKVEEEHIHSYDAGVVTKQATCEKEGVMIYTCTVCKYTYTENIPAIKHDYSIFEEILSATCQEEGIMTYYCTNCGGSKTEAIPIVDHDYAETVTPPTCVEMGYTTYTCSMCDDSYKTSYTTTVDHSYSDEWSSDETIHYHACANCDNKQYVAEHTFTWIVDKEATTTETGLKHEECNVCEYKRNENTVIEKLEEEHVHSYDEVWKTDSENHWKECACGEITESTVHSFEWKVDKEATTTETGIKHEECGVCEYKRNENTVIEKLEEEHAHTYDEGVVSKRATCEEDGFMLYTCSVCKYTYTEIIHALEHDYSISEETTPATCIAEGIMTYYCTNCGGEKTEIIPTIAHEYIASVTAPTCVKMGYTTYTCSMCEDSYKTSYTATVDHSYSDEWSSDETIHYHVCANCDNKQYVAEHTFTWIVDKEATTTETGLKHEECSVCEYKRNENTVIEKLEEEHVHSYEEVWKTDSENHWKECACGEIAESTAHTFEWKVDKEATTEESGLKHEECSVCEYKRNENTVIDKLEEEHKHIYAEEWKTDAEKHWKVCTCEEIVESTAHTFEWKVDKVATTTESGVKHEECTVCKYRRNEFTIINKLESTHTHSYVTNLIQATVESDGSIENACSACGDIASSTVIYRPKIITLSQATYTYTGKAFMPTVTVKDSSGEVIPSSNYTVSYRNNKAVGLATVMITFNGNYTGTITDVFTIIPKGTKITKISAKKNGFLIKWKKQKKETTGYEIQYSTSKKFKGAKIVRIGKNKTISKSISKLKAKKKYYVRIRTYKTVSGKKFYSEWSKVKNVKTAK